MSKIIKVVLVEDNPEYRHVIEFSLKNHQGIQLINKFGTAELALRSLQSRATQTTPDVILLDLSLPGMSGLEAIPWILKYTPDTHIIVLTQSESKADVLTAIQSGASGYLLKSTSIQEIKSGIQTVVDGGASLDPKMARYILNSIEKKKTPVKESSPLSKREIEILSLISDGLTRKEICHQLDISYKTVANHIAHIFEKLNVPNAPSAITQAYKTGILPFIK